jgi:hypothetical protein
VINISSPTTGTIYLVTETQNVPVGQTPGNWYHWLHAVDIQSFNDTKVQICPTTCGQYSSKDFSHGHIQRPGLLFANCGASCGNYVYVSFSMMDGSGWPWHNGVVFAYNTANLGGSYFYFQTSNGQADNTSYGGGIWMGGAAPAFGPDKNGKNLDLRDYGEWRLQPEPDTARQSKLG